MESGRPLRDVFAELLHDESTRQAYAADPDGFLESYGHGELPASLVTEAVVSFADTAPPDVAEYLAPFVIANSPVPADEAIADDDGLGMLAGAPPGLGAEDFGPDDLTDIDAPIGAELGSPTPAGEPLIDIDFGGGTADFTPADSTPPDSDAALPAMQTEPAGTDEPFAGDQLPGPEIDGLPFDEYEPSAEDDSDEGDAAE